MALNQSKRLRHYIDYLVPREVLGPVIVAFSAENIISAAFRAMVPPIYATLGWTIILLVSLAIITFWGEVDEDRDGLEDRLNGLEGEA